MFNPNFAGGSPATSCTAARPRKRTCEREGLRAREWYLQVRTVLTNTLVMTRSPEVADGELATTEGGDDEAVLEEKPLRTTRRLREARLGIAVAPGTRRPRP